MVTRDDVISVRWSSHFWVKMHVFSTSFNNKSTKLVDEMMQSAYLWLILHVKHKNKTFIAVLTWLIILVKSKMSAKMNQSKLEKSTCVVKRALKRLWPMHGLEFWLGAKMREDMPVDQVVKEQTNDVVNRPIKPFFFTLNIKALLQFCC